jgi:hypothetical protein
VSAEPKSLPIRKVSAGLFDIRTSEDRFVAILSFPILNV